MSGYKQLSSQESAMVVRRRASQLLLDRSANLPEFLEVARSLWNIRGSSWCVSLYEVMTRDGQGRRQGEPKPSRPLLSVGVHLSLSKHQVFPQVFALVKHHMPLARQPPVKNHMSASAKNPHKTVSRNIPHGKTESSKKPEISTSDFTGHLLCWESRYNEDFYIFIR